MTTSDSESVMASVTMPALVNDSGHPGVSDDRTAVIVTYGISDNVSDDVNDHINYDRRTDDSICSL
jgi:hypothetical protein